MARVCFDTPGPGLPRYLLAIALFMAALVSSNALPAQEPELQVLTPPLAQLLGEDVAAEYERILAGTAAAPALDLADPCLRAGALLPSYFATGRSSGHSDLFTLSTYPPALCSAAARVKGGGLAPGGASTLEGCEEELEAVLSWLASTPEWRSRGGRNFVLCSARAPPGARLREALLVTPEELRAHSAQQLTAGNARPEGWRVARRHVLQVEEGEAGAEEGVHQAFVGANGEEMRRAFDELREESGEALDQAVAEARSATVSDEETSAEEEGTGTGAAEDTLAEEDTATEESLTEDEASAEEETPAEEAIAEETAAEETTGEEEATPAEEETTVEEETSAEDETPTDGEETAAEEEVTAHEEITVSIHEEEQTPVEEPIETEETVIEEEGTGADEEVTGEKETTAEEEVTAHEEITVSIHEEVQTPAEEGVHQAFVGTNGEELRRAFDERREESGEALDQAIAEPRSATVSDEELRTETQETAIEEEPATEEATAADEEVTAEEGTTAEEETAAEEEETAAEDEDTAHEDITVTIHEEERRAHEDITVTVHEEERRAHEEITVEIAEGGGSAAEAEEENVEDTPLYLLQGAAGEAAGEAGVGGPAAGPADGEGAAGVPDGDASGQGRRAGVLRGGGGGGGAFDPEKAAQREARRQHDLQEQLEREEAEARREQSKAEQEALYEANRKARKARKRAEREAEEAKRNGWQRHERRMARHAVREMAEKNGNVNTKDGLIESFGAIIADDGRAGSGAARAGALRKEAPSKVERGPMAGKSPRRKAAGREGGSDEDINININIKRGMRKSAAGRDHLVPMLGDSSTAGAKKKSSSSSSSSSKAKQERVKDTAEEARKKAKENKHNAKEAVKQAIQKQKVSHKKVIGANRREESAVGQARPSWHPTHARRRRRAEAEAAAATAGSEGDAGPSSPEPQPLPHVERGAMLKQRSVVYGNPMAYCTTGIFTLFDDLIKVRPPSLFIDVGAYDGEDALQYAAAGHEVLSFEPVPHKHKRIKAKYAKSPHADRIHFYPVALSNYTGSAKFQVNTESHGAGGSKKQARSKKQAFKGQDQAGGSELGSEQDSFWVPWSGAQSVDVKVATLDEYIGDRRVFYLKVDAQGHDPLVLLGARKALTEHRVDIVNFEYAPKLTPNPATYTEVLDMLHGLGYRCFDCKYFKLAGNMRGKTDNAVAYDAERFLKAMSKDSVQRRGTDHGAQTDIICMLGFV